MTIIEIQGFSLLWDRDTRQWAGPDVPEEIIQAANTDLPDNYYESADPHPAYSRAVHLQKVLKAKIVSMDPKTQAKFQEEDVQ